MFQVMRVLHAKVTPSLITSATPKSAPASKIVSSAFRTATSSPHAAMAVSIKGSISVNKKEPSHLVDHNRAVAPSMAFSATMGGNSNKSTALQDLHTALNLKISRSWVYMVCCGFLMVGAVGITMLIGLNVQYMSPEFMVLYQFLVLFDILKSLCEIRIISISWDSV